MTSTLSPLHKFIQAYYTKQVQQNKSCCLNNTCCSSVDTHPSFLFENLPAEEQPLSYGCGDPLAIAELHSGQVVLDLGSGAGYDCFLAAKQVGENGKVIGVDMTPQMIVKASQTAQRLGLSNVEFRLGYLEDLPIDTNSVDVIISNCVINLVPDKYGVLREAYRVLKPGGRIAIMDMISLQPLPAELREDTEAWAACLVGALTKHEWVEILSAIGFEKIEISFSEALDIQSDAQLKGLAGNQKSTNKPEHFLVSARIRASK